MTVEDDRVWAVVPAAGVGARMGAEVPKQYLPLLGRPLIEHTLERLLGHPRIAGVVVAVAAGDERWRALGLAGRSGVATVTGGAERCHSVLNALDWLLGRGHSGAWVLVHDAARPCLSHGEIDRLLEALADDPIGGLLGLPVRDTMKRAGARDRVAATVPREGLWHALTPQMFRTGALRAALAAALGRGELVTDESSAMELAGHAPRLVPGRPENIKVTRPEDLALAELYLRQQGGTTG
ncbi:MAG: 2-C-methyl-D-erythritol 4-phosphate cytidylyltransferase [Gammaproteobacteria bacterium]|nr:2-C-methyl-D-erythritol 4-phosphate cytidylyltransferase [Gammaproteobacteria bacterium]